MSGDVREVAFWVTTTDYEHWTPEQRAAAEAAGAGIYSDYAVQLLETAMRAAGQAVIDAHPEMFAIKELM